MAARRDPGLADHQVAQLRSQVAAGRRPRVRVSGSQFPAATIGTVLRVGDRGVDGEDFVTVRVKVGGVTDELGFAPGELSMAGRGRPDAPTATPPVVSVKHRPAPEPHPAARPPRSARRAAPIPPVTVTITSAGASWTVTAHRGARVVVRNAVVTPGVVAAVAALLAQPTLEDAVAEVNDTTRGEAEARAQRLRAELAEVEAVLVSHRRP